MCMRVYGCVNITIWSQLNNDNLLRRFTLVVFFWIGFNRFCNLNENLQYTGSMIHMTCSYVLFAIIWIVFYSLRRRGVILILFMSISIYKIDF